MRILQTKPHQGATEKMRLEKDSDSHWGLTYNDIEGYLCFRLVRENNRGWTFENHTITGNKTTLFFSRGDHEIKEIE